MKPARLALAACLCLAACSRKAPAPAEPKGERPAMAMYEHPQRLFACQAPPDWRVLEDQGGSQRATFLGPAGGKAPFSASISIFEYAAGGAFAAPQDYARAQATAGAATELKPRAWKGGQAFEFSQVRKGPKVGAQKPESREELTVLIPARGGFFALVHSAPEGGLAQTAPEFEALLDSFRPAP
ncbi:MAG: hypothetical protein PHU21_08830 [Elusimicrobia bacterium]|nr:hypothetical protein [Elusimicrobiota bacterium]